MILLTLTLSVAASSFNQNNPQRVSFDRTEWLRCTRTRDGSHEEGDGSAIRSSFRPTKGTATPRALRQEHILDLKPHLGLSLGLAECKKRSAPQPQKPTVILSHTIPGPSAGAETRNALECSLCAVTESRTFITRICTWAG